MTNYTIETFAGDTVTPIAIFQSLQGSHKTLFESSAKHQESGRYSFIAVDPLQSVTGEDNTTTITYRDGTTKKITKNILQYAKETFPKTDEALPFLFFGGAIGYIGYDTIFTLENIGEKKFNDNHLPDAHLLFFDTFIVFDHVKETISLVATSLLNERDEAERLQAIQKLQQALQPQLHPTEESGALQFEANIEADDFRNMVETAKNYIEQGEVFQIVLSQRFSAKFSANPFALYRKLRTANPSPYMFFIDFEGYTVLGTSPESLIKVSSNTVITNPIAGTRPRGKNEVEDTLLASELLADDKELAEHRMLVDLSRNDIGKIANIGSIQVSRYAEIEKYQHVMHIVSEVKGQLAPQYHALDALIACLPAGTVSGAPKIRAMQIINELEPTKRGVYAGAVGYVSVGGNMDFALAIRTMVIKDGIATVQAGAGIVYDSVPQKEYEETLHKAKALLEVVSQ